MFKTLKSMKESATIIAVTFGGVSEVLEVCLVWFEDIICLLSAHLEDDNHECSHQECSIHHLVARGF